jgi:hypothetical protein
LAFHRSAGLIGFSFFTTEVAEVGIVIWDVDIMYGNEFYTMFSISRKGSILTRSVFAYRRSLLISIFSFCPEERAVLSAFIRCMCDIDFMRIILRTCSNGC